MAFPDLVLVGVSTCFCKHPVSSQCKHMFLQASPLAPWWMAKVKCFSLLCRNMNSGCVHVGMRSVMIMVKVICNFSICIWQHFYI